MRIELPPEIQLRMAKLELAVRERHVAAAKADPVKHKKTLQFESDLRWLYYGSITSRGKRYRYAYSTTRNAAGYFLTWREVWDAKRGVGKRDMFVASKRRKTVAAKALARYKRHKQHNAA